MSKTYECPLCLSTRSGTLASADVREHPLFNEKIPETIHWELCLDCEVVFRREAIPDEDLMADALEHETPSAKALNAQIHTYAIPILASNATGSTVLDFGCGSGAAGFCAQAMGFPSVTFVDARWQVRKLLKALGERAESEIPHGEKFDLIFACDVIEHVELPTQLLRKLHDAMCPMSRLILSTPNPTLPVWRLLMKDNPYYREIEHRFIFTPQRLMKLANEAGLVLQQTIPNSRYLAGLDYIFARAE